MTHPIIKLFYCYSIWTHTHTHARTFFIFPAPIPIPIKQTNIFCEMLWDDAIRLFCFLNLYAHPVRMMSDERVAIIIIIMNWTFHPSLREPNEANKYIHNKKMNWHGVNSVKKRLIIYTSGKWGKELIHINQKQQQPSLLAVFHTKNIQNERIVYLLENNTETAKLYHWVNSGNTLDVVMSRLDRRVNCWLFQFNRMIICVR